MHSFSVIKSSNNLTPTILCAIVMSKRTTQWRKRRLRLQEIKFGKKPFYCVLADHISVGYKLAKQLNESPPVSCNSEPRLSTPLTNYIPIPDDTVLNEPQELVICRL